MYAIIEDGGTQIKVSQGDVIKVALRELPPDAGALTFDRILLVGDLEGGQPARIGAPVLEGVTVTADILPADDEGLVHKDEKVEIYRFRRRKNYRRHRGHRQKFLKVKITAIQA